MAVCGTHFSLEKWTRELKKENEETRERDREIFFFLFLFTYLFMVFLVFKDVILVVVWKFCVGCQ